MYRKSPSLSRITHRPFQASDLDLMDYYDWSQYDHQAALYCEKLIPNATYFDFDRILACGGLNIIYRGFAEAWVYLPKDAGKTSVMIVKDQLQEWIEQYQLIRVQATAMADWRNGCRFLEWLGMQYEGRMRKSSIDGRDQALYAWVRI